MRRAHTKAQFAQAPIDMRVKIGPPHARSFQLGERGLKLAVEFGCFRHCFHLKCIIYRQIMTCIAQLLQS